ncbi:MAG: cyclodeaminase [Thalassobaculum sp.]|uniref:cyclodeaminase n=1 Tax=Thalassobaculum sp. TaxID=2022740 RepID=UPI0032EB6F0E
MAEVLVLTERELRGCVALDLEAVEIVERAFAALGDGNVVMPPVLSMAIEERHAEVDVKTAYVPGLDGFAIKVSPGFFDNPRRGLPSLNGMMIVLSAETGIVQAALLDNGYLTDVRTAAAGAVAARHLAPKTVRRAGVLGAGLQAELQIRALALVRQVPEVLVWARDPAKAAAWAARMADALGVPVTPCANAEQVVRGCDVVITTTPSRSPLVEADWLHPGLHVTAMGSDAPDKNELAPAVLARADRFVCDRRSQSVVLGELRSAIAAGAVPADWPVDELGEIVAGHKPGRRSADEITVCDLTGTGVQDTAIATHALRVARASGAGHAVQN